VTIDLRLISVFATLSLLGFGGGKGIWPQMHAEVVDRLHWITSSQFAEFYTIGRLVPGPTTIMTALIGYAVCGVGGAVVATLAMFVPAALLMLAVGRAWSVLRDSPWKDAIGHGLAPVVIGLMWSSVLTIGKGIVHDAVTLGIALAAAAVTLRTAIGAPVVIAAAGIAGAVLLR
jgi:chromate transporter